MFLRIMEFLAVALGCILIGTQVLIPLMFNRKIFPLFRSRAVVEKQIQQANEELDEAQLNATLGDVRDRVEEVKAPKAPAPETPQAQ